MKSLLQNTEVFFWDTITTMMSQSIWIQKTIRVVYPIMQGINPVKLLKTLAITCVSGFVTGWILYYISQLL